MTCKVKGTTWTVKTEYVLRRDGYAKNCLRSEDAEAILEYMAAYCQADKEEIRKVLWPDDQEHKNGKE